MKRKIFKSLFFTVLFSFIVLNIIAAFQAWYFTHFQEENIEKSSTEISPIEEYTEFLLGKSKPHPKAARLPKLKYYDISIEGEPRLKAWHLPAQIPKGIILFCHAYSKEKAEMLEVAEPMVEMGYSCVVLDFSGAGESSDNQCTIGYKEADQVKRAYDYLKEKSSLPIILYGRSMGATAIMRAQALYQMEVEALILECPFSNLLSIVKARFKMRGIPRPVLSELFVFWGSALNGINGFSHNPEEYAKEIKTPVLLLHGGRDTLISIQEAKTIYANFQGPKRFRLFPKAAHERYNLQYKAELEDELSQFLGSLDTTKRPQLFSVNKKDSRDEWESYSLIYKRMENDSEIIFQYGQELDSNQVIEEYSHSKLHLNKITKNIKNEYSEFDYELLESIPIELSEGKDTLFVYSTKMIHSLYLTISPKKGLICIESIHSQRKNTLFLPFQNREILDKYFKLNIPY